MDILDKEKSLTIKLSESNPKSEEQKIQDSNLSECQKQFKRANYLLKSLQDFSNRYDLDSKNILSGKKFLLAFGDIISLIKDVINYQNKIFELDLSDKEKIQEISQDFINNLSYTIFSFEKLDISNNSKKEKNRYNTHNLRNKILNNNKNIKANLKHGKNNSNILTTGNKEEENNKGNNGASINFSLNNKNKDANNGKIKEKNKFKKEIKCYNPNSKSSLNKKKFNNNITKNNIDLNSKILKTSYRTKIKEIKQERKKTMINGGDEKNNINIKNKKIKNLNAKMCINNIKTSPQTTKNSNKKGFGNFNSQLEYSIKNNSSVLRSNSVSNQKIKSEKINVMDSYNLCSTFNDLEQKLLDSQSVKEGLIIKGKINIFSNVPKPSLLANKLLESSKKFINDYNGVNEEEEKKRNLLYKRSHSYNYNRNLKKKNKCI